jgi:4-diphosphocytidyl-2-C-methyl-D-erythritol kinase
MASMSPEPRPDRLIVFAPAKINLCLHVGDKRADGFHDLESLVVFVDAGDVLHFERANDLSLSITGPFADALSNGDDNLVLKAARLLANRSNADCGARLSLQKNLPVASGIGGGSADAAAVLRGLVSLWNLDISSDELHAVAAELGSDVPVCLKSAPARMEGRGERVIPISEFPYCWLLLINPLVSVSTAEVFRKLGRSSHPPLEGGSKSSLSGSEKRISGRGKATFSENSPSPKNPPDFSTLPQGEGGNFSIASLVRFLGETKNDLEAPAREIAPEIGAVLHDIAREPGVLLTRMSGSGATCFGIFADGGAAITAAKSIESRQANWWVTAAKLASPELGRPQLA